MPSTRSTSPPKSAWPGCIDDIDVHAFILHRAVLRQNGDAALFFQVVGIHHALGDMLVRGESASLLQQLVHQGGLAVVNVGDDGDITELAGFLTYLSRVCKSRLSKKPHKILKGFPVSNDVLCAG